MNLRILLADDHTLLREGLKVLLEQEKGLTVVAGDRAHLEKTIADDTRLTTEQVKAAKVAPE